MKKLKRIPIESIQKEITVKIQIRCNKKKQGTHSERRIRKNDIDRLRIRLFTNHKK